MNATKNYQFKFPATSSDDGTTIKHDATLILVTAMVFSFCIMAGGIVVLNLKRRRRRGKPNLTIQNKHIEYSHLMSTSVDDI